MGMRAFDIQKNAKRCSVHAATLPKKLNAREGQPRRYAQGGDPGPHSFGLSQNRPLVRKHLHTRLMLMLRRVGRSVRTFRAFATSSQANVLGTTRFRYVVNQLARELSEEEYRSNEARISLIDTTTWSRYVNKVRRDLIKRDAIKMYGGERIAQRDIEPDALTSDVIQNEKKLEALSNEIEGMIKIDSELSSESLQKITDEERKSQIEAYKERVFDLVVNQAVVDLADIFQAHKILSATSDLRIPHEWYPYARMLKRKIIYHGGPTNSGKTYSALQRLKEADTEKGGGLYCGPLRLLSLEVFESLNRQGVYTSLMTGQEKREVPGATHISCTLEMVSLNREYDVAVIDEIQMICNGERGYAWTRALLGLRAREIHVCGGLEASDIVRMLSVQAGDDFELKEYKRLSATLNVHDESFRGDYKHVRPGDW